MGIWTLTLTFGTWVIRDLRELVKLNYSSNKTPSCGTILDTTNGAHDSFLGGGNNVGGHHAN
jgi:hypothetical protein